MAKSWWALRLFGNDLSSPTDFLHLSRSNIERIRELLSLSEPLNPHQCRSMSCKLERTMQGVERIVRSVDDKSLLPQSAALENFYRVSEKGRQLVEDCCKEDWWQAAAFQIQNEEAFREILLEAGLSYNTIFQVVEDVNMKKKKEFSCEDLREKATFDPSGADEVLKDRVALQERLNGIIVSDVNFSIRSRWLGQYLLRRVNYVLQRSSDADCDISSFNQWADGEGPDREWGADTFLGGHVCKTTWLDVPCAKKVFQDEGYEEEWLAEAKILASLNHPNIVKFLCCNKYRTTHCTGHFIAMEQMETSLATFIKRLREEGAKPSLSQKLDVILQIAHGLCYLHHYGIAHRDLKTSNVVVRNVTGPHLQYNLEVKLVDFGISKVKLKAGKSNTITRPKIGTTVYMPPEAFTNGRADWFKADVYSFSVMCSVILSCREPFHDVKRRSDLYGLICSGERPELPGDTPKDLADVIKEGWATERKQRPSVLDICSRLEKLRHGLLRNDGTWSHVREEDSRGSNAYIDRMLKKRLETRERDVSHARLQTLTICMDEEEWFGEDEEQESIVQVQQMSLQQGERLGSSTGSGAKEYTIPIVCGWSGSAGGRLINRVDIEPHQGASEVDSQGAEDMQRRLRKERQQKAILEEFAAKRKAFMEIQNISDDEGSEDDSDTEVSNVAMEKNSEMKECALCKRDKDEKNSSPCWNALVQRYNFPCQVLKRGEPVEKAGEGGLGSKFHQSSDLKSMDVDINLDLDQLVTVGRPTGSEEASAIDFSTVQHVQCCGHQMHYDCFLGHINSLQLNHNAGGCVVDPLKVEFQCPLCRRLANVLLPVVDASLLSRKHDSHDDGKSSQETGSTCGMFWQSNKNLESAMDSFCCQVLRVKDQSPQSFLSPPSTFEISQALWEGLVMNVVHCEVETRGGFVKTDAALSSCSSTPIKSSDECTWGGDSSHWIALRELGKLAVLSNTLPGAVQEKSQRLRMLWKSLRLLGRKENLAGSAACLESSPVQAGTSELEKIIHEIFHERPPDLGEPSELLEITDLAPGSSHCQDEAVIYVENSVSTPSSTYEQKEEQLSYNTSSNYSMQLEGSKDPYFIDSKYAVTQRPVLATPDSIANDPQQKFEITFEDAEFENSLREGNVNDMIDMSHVSSLEQQQSCSGKDKRNSNWIADTLRNGIFTADPFRLLTLLLIIFNGQPDRSSLHSMVKFAYTVAVLQAQIAITKLGVEGPEVESFVQRACLPFLRRAAMLVQIITREDFRGHHGLSGTKVMEFLNLQLALQLPDCAQILQTQVHGATETLATQLLHLYEPVSKNFTFELRKVPRKAQLFKLPHVFQELLLENIHNKKTCAFCEEVPADPAICLICGVLLCCGTDFCKRDGLGECSRHAAEESAGVGIFLLLRSTQLLLVRNNRTCMGLSLYLDRFGKPAQEDLYLRRSQLLYLSDRRLNEVRRLWMTAAFDYDSYILHNSQSRVNVY